ncbi:MAG: cysteine dioxygenase family protein [Rhodanobacter sp.]
MRKPRQTLNTLRAIALEHASVAVPDLASMARELGRVVHRSSSAIASPRARMRQRGQGLRRWLLAQRSQPAVSVVVMAWPANHCTPLYDHAGLWGLELTLVGALEMQSWRRDPSSGDLRALGRDWLGPGDGIWFEDGQEHLHRCRNLSQNETALTLHVYGGDLTSYRTCEEAMPAGMGKTRLQQNVFAGHLNL